jgi:hypothetical protein
METGIVVLLLLAAISTVYSLILQQPAVYTWYAHDRTWVTVVIGNAMIGFALLGWLWFEGMPLTAFWMLLGCNVAAGIPIIVWQVHEAHVRRKERRRVE